MDGYVTIGTNLDTKSFDAQIDYVESQLQEIEDKLKQADMGFEVGDTQKLEAQYERLTQKLSTLRQKQADLNKTDLSNIQKSIDNVGNSTSNVIKKVGKWALAIFGVRSAYMFVRQSASTLSQYNEKIGADLEYIRFALASTLQPVIEGLIQLAYKLLTYVNYIAQAWFGVNLFANASAKAMNKGAKSAEKIKKSLAGFDEMNIMQDTTGGGAGGGTTAPSIDLSQWQGEVPSWIKWIADNKDIVIAGLLGIAGGLTAVSFGLTAIQGLGIGLILAGIILLIQVIINYLKDPTWENFGKILLGIGIIVSGVLLIFGGIPALITLIIGVITALGIAIYKNWDKIKEWTLELVNKIKEFFGGAIDWIKNKFNSMITFFSGLISKIVGLFKTIGTKVGNVIGSAFKIVINGILKSIENILNSPINSINKLIGVINKVPGINISTLPTFSLPRLAVGGIVNMPGRGIDYGGANIAERGAEAVIPLTNSQSLDMIADAIGKRIVINANITNTMNGRVISKELKRINNDSDFAFNR